MLKTPLKTRVNLSRYGNEVIITHTFAPFPQAQFAMELMKHLAIVAGTSDGESSDGRQKLRPLTPDEITERACNIAQSAYEQFEKRGWLLPLPELPPTEDKPAA